MATTTSREAEGRPEQRRGAKRELFKAAEVCEMTQVKPYVLRTWEAEFPSLGQVSGSGQRVYRRADVDKVLRIKQLVFVEGLTLAGARRQLEEEETDRQIAAEAMDDGLDDTARSRLREVKSGLEAIMRLLARDVEGAAAPELQLVPPPVSRPVVRATPKRASVPARRSAKAAVKRSSRRRRSA